MGDPPGGIGVALAVGVELGGVGVPVVSRVGEAVALPGEGVGETVGDGLAVPGNGVGETVGLAIGDGPALAVAVSTVAVEVSGPGGVSDGTGLGAA